ncbi:MAG: hypothetical protein IKM35_01055 [Bacteroidaceae bacterium]|nr:hypothetical protein [Bacteroidaceae bacterium]
MADNFLEKQYAEYQARKAAQEQARRKAWQKKMKEYKSRLAAQKQQSTDSEGKEAPSDPEVQ